MVGVGVTAAVDTAAGSLGVVVASVAAGTGVVGVISDGAALGACGGKSGREPSLQRLPRGF
jgi:hypothetical protein